MLLVGGVRGAAEPLLWPGQPHEKESPRGWSALRAGHCPGLCVVETYDFLELQSAFLGNETGWVGWQVEGEGGGLILVQPSTCHRGPRSCLGRGREGNGPGRLRAFPLHAVPPQVSSSRRNTLLVFIRFIMSKMAEL